VSNSKKNSFNRSDIEKELRASFPSLTSKQITSALDTIIQTITDSIALDDRVEIRGFGTFSKKYIRPRKFTNPKTKKISYLGETATINFKSSKKLNLK